MSGYPLTRSRKYLVILACVLVLSTGIVIAAQAEITADELTITGDSVIKTEDDVTYVAGWKPYTVTSNITGDSGQYDACLVLGGAVEEHEIECKVIEVNDSQPATISFDNSTWPANVSGQQTLSLVINSDNSSSDLTTPTRQVNILRENGDPDNDGVSNREEITNSINPLEEDTDGDSLTDRRELNLPTAIANNSDTDGDGLSDGIEVNYDSSPNDTDTDSDGLNDRVEVNKHGTKPGKADSDNDGLLDKAEIKEHKTNPKTKHSDDDKLSDQKEVNILGTNPNDADSDSDGLDDDVEVKPPETDSNNPDTDNDSLLDGPEVNKYDTDPNNADTDGDGVDDAAEIKNGTDPNGQSFFLLTPRENPIKTAGTVAGVVLVVAIGWYWRRRRSAKTVQIDETVASKEPNQKADAENTDANSERIAVTEPLTDEDRIEQLLDDNGGRLHQSEIVSKTGWSKSKVSRLLSRMEDDGLITKISVGRENLITRSGDEPRHAGSAFED